MHQHQCHVYFYSINIFVILPNICVLFIYLFLFINTIRSPILRDKLLGMGVAPLPEVSWIIDYLTARPQFVRMGRGISGTLECSTEAPQGAVLAPFAGLYEQLRVLPHTVVF